MIPLIPNNGILKVVIISRDQSAPLCVIPKQSQRLIREPLSDDQVSLFSVWQAIAVLIPAFESDPEDRHLDRSGIDRQGVTSPDETTADICPARGVLNKEVLDSILDKGVEFCAHRGTRTEDRAEVLEAMGLFDDDAGLL